ncbi:MAG: transglutaminase family protein [Burkholderiales bacterium]|nr:transglutaminase family protein [Burkholderiales bacterium]
MSASPETTTRRSVVRISYSIELKYQIAEQPADFVFNVHAARTPSQTVVVEALCIEPRVEPLMHTDPALGNRYMRLHAGPGPMVMTYGATVDIDHHRTSPALLEEVPIRRMPQEALAFIYPSRYCQSDRLRRFAAREFGHLRPGYWRVQAILDWVRTRVVFMPGVSNSSSSAMDTLVEQVGVCRDFAHLMIALCRAINIPARFVTGIDYGAAAHLGLPDFHAYVEVFLGERWYSFDPTGITVPMGLVRIGTGRDAADVSFATMFGAVTSQAPIVTVSALDDPRNGYDLPSRSSDALSSSGVCVAA